MNAVVFSQARATCLKPCCHLSSAGFEVVGCPGVQLEPTHRDMKPRAGPATPWARSVRPRGNIEDVLQQAGATWDDHYVDGLEPEDVEVADEPDVPDVPDLAESEWHEEVPLRPVPGGAWVQLEGGQWILCSLADVGLAGQQAPPEAALPAAASVAAPAVAPAADPEMLQGGRDSGRAAGTWNGKKGGKNKGKNRGKGKGKGWANERRRPDGAAATVPLPRPPPQAAASEAVVIGVDLGGVVFQWNCHPTDLVRGAKTGLVVLARLVGPQKIHFITTVGSAHTYEQAMADLSAFRILADTGVPEANVHSTTNDNDKLSKAAEIGVHIMIEDRVPVLKLCSEAWRCPCSMVCFNLPIVRALLKSGAVA